VTVDASSTDGRSDEPVDRGREYGDPADSQPVGSGGAPEHADIDVEPAARGAVYALVAAAFTEADDDLYRQLADGTFASAVEDAVARSGLDVAVPDLRVAEDRTDLSARFNDLFVVGYAEVIDRTDGTLDSTGPPVSLYESEYRSEVSWNDVNLDLARAYEYFGLEVDEEVRRNHDHLRLELEFAGYLCRRQAAVDPDLARARLDFHDRHLRVVASGVADALDAEPGTAFYGRLATFLDRFSAADVEDLADRVGGDAE